MKKIAICLTFVMLCLTGCGTTDQMDANQSESQQANAKSGSDQAVLNEYNNLIFGKDADGKAIASFIKNNANVVSEEASSQMVLQFEEFQKNKLPLFEDKFNTGSVQKELMELYMQGGDINDPVGVSRPEVAALVEEAKNSGYKLIQADGACFPVIDYTFYKNFGENITPEVSEYISILELNSNQPPLHNASLAISWDELIERAVRQERFLTDYDDTKTAEKLTPLYQSYTQIIFFGSDNTPLFDTATGILKDEVKTAFENAVKSNKNSALIKKIKGFLKALKKDNYRYSEDAEQYREDIKF